MSIGPVGNLPPIPDPQSPERKGVAWPVAPSSNSEPAPRRESAAAKSVPSVPTVGQDEVRVQWDKPMADYIEIYQVVNQQSGSLVVQEPNQEMLSLIHQIRVMLQSTQAQSSAVSAGPVRAVEG